MTKAEVNALAQRMIATWKRVDPDSNVMRYPASYIANFADMARDLLFEYTIVPKAEQEEALQHVWKLIAAWTDSIPPDELVQAIKALPGNFKTGDKK